MHSGGGRKRGEGGAKEERRKSEGRANGWGRVEDGVGMEKGLEWGRNVVEWKKMCIFAK